MDSDSLVRLISDYSKQLKQNGKIIIISASFLDESVNNNFSFIRCLKGITKSILEWSGIRTRGQFWGWMRSSDEYHQVLLDVGLNNLEDGFINDKNKQSYWISGDLVQ